MLAEDRCLLNTGACLCICLFGELDTCLLNTGCLLNKVATKTGLNLCLTDSLSV